RTAWAARGRPASAPLPGVGRRAAGPRVSWESRAGARENWAGSRVEAHAAPREAEPPAAVAGAWPGVAWPAVAWPGAVAAGRQDRGIAGRAAPVAARQDTELQERPPAGSPVAAAGYPPPVAAAGNPEAAAADSPGAAAEGSPAAAAGDSPAAAAGGNPAGAVVG